MQKVQQGNAAASLDQSGAFGGAGFGSEANVAAVLASTSGTLKIGEKSESFSSEVVTNAETVAPFEGERRRAVAVAAGVGVAAMGATAAKGNVYGDGQPHSNFTTAGQNPMFGHTVWIRGV